MLRWRLGACAGLVIAVAAGWALHSSHTSHATVNIQVEDAWLAATPAGATTAALYATIRGRGGSDELLGVDVPTNVASAAMLHRTTTSGGLSGMRDMSSLALPAGALVEFRPGSDHVMLMGLRRRLRPGAAIRVVFHFRHAREQAVVAHVRALP